MWSRTYYSITLLFLFFGLCPILKADVAFSNQPLTKIQAEALSTGNPYFVYVYQEKNRTCKRMSRKTWRDKDLASWIEGNFIAGKLDVFSPETDIRWVQQYEVYSYPSILFFSSEGRLLGKAEGYLAPETLLLMLQKHHQEQSQQEEVRLWATHYQQIEEILPIAHLSDLKTNLSDLNIETEEFPEKPVPETAEALAMVAPIMTSRGISENQSRILLVVPGMERFSLTNYSQSRGDEEKMDYGLLVGSYTSYQELENQLGRFQKFWQDDVWVYCEEVNQTPVYKLLVGPYVDQESAQTFAHAMYKFQQINPVVLNLNNLLQ